MDRSHRLDNLSGVGGLQGLQLLERHDGRRGDFTSSGGDDEIEQPRDIVHGLFNIRSGFAGL